MSSSESLANLIPLRNPADPAMALGRISARPKRLLSVADVADWLGVSKGWVRDHACGRRQPCLRAIKLGPPNGKGLWKFREEDVQEFIEARARTSRPR